MATCRARNPLTCRTHGQTIRADVTAVHAALNAEPPFSYVSRDRAAWITQTAADLDAGSATFVTGVLDKLWQHRSEDATIPNYMIRDEFDDALVQARFDMHRGPIDFSSYPIASLRNGHNDMDRRIWLRDHGIPDEAPDTTFGTQYVYCASHVRPHEAGWCTVSITNKGPLSATSRESSYLEARALGLPIYGEN